MFLKECKYIKKSDKNTSDDLEFFTDDSEEEPLNKHVKKFHLCKKNMCCKLFKSSLNFFRISLSFKLSSFFKIYFRLKRYCLKH